MAKNESNGKFNISMSFKGYVKTSRLNEDVEKNIVKSLPKEERTDFDIEIGIGGEIESVSISDAIKRIGEKLQDENPEVLKLLSGIEPDKLKKLKRMLDNL